MEVTAFGENQILDNIRSHWVHNCISIVVTFVLTLFFFASGTFGQDFQDLCYGKFMMTMSITLLYVFRLRTVNTIGTSSVENDIGEK